MTASGRNVKIIIVLVTGLAGTAAIGTSLFYLHRSRKQAAAEAALARGTKAYEAGRFTHAAADLGRYLAVRGHDTDALFRYADAQMRRRPQYRDSIQQAVTALETILRLDRGHNEAARRLAGIYLAGQMPIEAERIARTWMRTRPQDPQPARTLAAALVAQQRYDEAVEALQALLTAHPGHAEAASALALLDVTRNDQDPQQAEQILSRTVVASAFDDGGERTSADAAGEAAALLTRARFRAATGQFPQALADLDKAAQLPTHNVETILGIGQMFLDLGLHDLANDQFDRAMDVAPDQANVLLVCGRAALQTQDPDRAAAIADRIVSAGRGEDSIDLLPTAVELYVANHDLDSAQQCLEQLRSGGATSEVILYVQGLLHLEQGRIYEAIARLQTVEDRYERARLALARACSTAGDLTQAARCYEDHLHGEPAAPVRVRLELARVYAELGDWDQAARVAQEAAQRTPYDVAARLTSIEMQALQARHGLRDLSRASRPTRPVLEELRAEAASLVEQLPDEPAARVVLARLEGLLGHVDQAAAILRPLMQAKEPTDTASRAASVLIEIYAENGHNEQAIDVCREGMTRAVGRQRLGLMARLAELYADQEDLARATDVATSLLEEPPGPSRSKAIVRAAGALLQNQAANQARELLAAAAAEDTQDSQSRRMLLAILPPDATDRQDLVDDLRQIEGSNSAHYRVWQARLWLQDPQWTDYQRRAEAMLRECLQQDPGNAQATFLLGQWQDKAGQTDLAMAMYRKALELDPTNRRAAVRLLDLASRRKNWIEIEQVLAALPADEPAAEPYRIAAALRQANWSQAEALLAQRVQRDPADVASRLELASIKRMQGQFDQAEQLIDQARSLGPDRPDVMAAHVRLLTETGQYDRAIALCDQAAGTDPTPQSLLLRASIHETRGDNDAAARDLLEATRHHPSDEQAWLSLGQFHLRHGRTGQAIEVWQKAVAARDDLSAVRRALAKALLSGNPEQAAQGARLLQQMLAERPDDPDLLLMQARQLAAISPAGARALYEKAIQQDPNATRAYAGLAQLAIQRRQPERAAQLAERGLSVEPDNLDLLLIRGQMLQPHQPRQAARIGLRIEHLAKTALAIDPTDQAAAIALAQGRLLAGQRDQALEGLQTFVARPDATHRVGARLALAQIHLAGGEHAPAETWLEQAATLAPDRGDVVRMQVLCQAAQQNWPEVISIAEAYSRTHPDDIAVALTAARQLGRAAGSEKALAARLDLYEELARRAPQNARILGELGLVCLQAGKIAEASDHLRRAVEIDPDRLDLVNNLAWILCEKQQDPQAAARVAAAAVQAGGVGSDYASLLDTWGVIQYRLGKRLAAKEHLEESQRRLQECLAQRGASPATQASATWHLARTLAELDRTQSIEILEALLADPDRAAALSPGDRREADALLAVLIGQQQATVR